MIRKIRNKYLLYLISLFAYCLLPIAYSFSQPVSSPAVKCVSVAANGDVMLTWVIPALINPADSTKTEYQISYSLAPSTTYTVITTISSYSQTFYIHAGANANAHRVYYIVQTEYNPGTGTILLSPLDTFSTIFLNVSNPGGTGYAQLSWNAVDTPPIPTSTGLYKIYREYPIGNWTLYDSTANTYYTDKFHVCNDSIGYRIEIADSTGCTSVSNVNKCLIADGSDPVVPIDTLSVNNTGLATISWSVSPSQDVKGYIIYKNVGTGAAPNWQPVDTVWGRTSTFFTYPASKADSGSEQYCIAVLDSCGNKSALNIPPVFQTIYLSAAFNVCAGTAQLIWNQYINWLPNTSKYDILRSTNGGAFSIIAANPANDTTYLDTGIVFGTSYCYMIRATNGSKTSSSNKTCFTPTILNPPAFTYNRFATVLSNNSILITGHVDTSAGVSYYRLLRAAGSSGTFVFLPAVFLKTGNAISYTDRTVNTQMESYSYKWVAMDSCNKAIMTSNLGTTILLQASVALNVNDSLSWSAYGDWPDSVDHYEIYRAVDGVWNIAPVASVSGKTFYYIDNVSPFLATSTGVFSYYVVAIEGNGNPFGFKDSSKSNVTTIYEYPKIYVPNTFTPNGDGLNDIFKPVIGFIDPSEYSLRIYDNYGYPIMESTNPSDGWDGKKSGHPCMEGVYMYVINCAASNGANSQISGTISLIR